MRALQPARRIAHAHAQRAACGPAVCARVRALPPLSASAPALRSSSSSTSSSTSTPPLRFRASSTGTWYSITDAAPGETLKDIAKRHELPSIEATCGGQCECATCHAYIVRAKDGEGEDAVPSLDGELPEGVFPEKSEAEDDMLDYAIDRRASSRLTCQVTYTPEIAEWLHRTKSWIELPRF